MQPLTVGLSRGSCCIFNLPEEDRRPPKVETEEPVAVDDDTVDAEITDYSKRAGDRINKLKYEYHEERRAKEGAQKQAEEATKRLKTLLTDNQRLQQLVSQGSEVLNEQAVANAQFAKQSATDKFKKATGGDKMVARQPHEKEQVEFIMGNVLIQTNMVFYSTLSC